MVVSSTPWPQVRPTTAVLARAAPVVLGGYAAVALVVAIFDLGPPDFRRQISAAALLTINAVSIWLAFRNAAASHLSPAIRRTWRFLGLSSVCIFIGHVLWSWQAVVLGYVQISPWFETPFLVRYPFVLAGILSLPLALRSAEDRQRFFLDAASVVVAGAMGIWYFVIYPAPRPSASAYAVALLYSIGDLVLLLGIVTLWLRRGAFRGGKAITFLGAALLVNFVTNVVYALQVGAGTYRTGGVLHPFWVTATCLAAAAAERQYREGDVALVAVPVRGSMGQPSLAPYVALAAGYGLLLVVAARDVIQPLAGLVLGAMTLTALVVARQVAAVQENMRLLAERSAQESEARFRALVQHSSDVISILDPDTTIRFASPAVAGVVGQVPEELAGSRILDLIHPEDQDRAMRLIRGAAAGSEGSASADWRLRHKDGRWVFTENIVTNLLAEPTVAGVVVNTRDVSERRRLEDQLTWQAFHDPVTGLPNRLLFLDRVSHALARAARSEDAIAVLFVDLDNFKLVNDTFGHPEGDRVLVVTSERLSTCVRTGDTVARLGGDEFAVLLEDAKDVASVAEVAERIVTALAGPFELKGQATRVGGSVGIARSARSTSPDELLRDADVAMYFAKARGKGRFEMFEPEMHEAVRGRIENETDLRRAIEAEEFRLYYQPILRLATRAVIGCEALLRWEHPTRGLVTPDAFIPLAEETGLIVALGRWAIREACRQWRTWQDVADGELKLHINVSPRHFQDASLLADVAGALRDFGVPASALVLEITEGLLMQQTEATREKLRELKALGVSLAVDDFGTGYSSLGYLHRFPIDVLKVDRQFVENVDEGSGQAAKIVKTIVNLAQNLDLTTIAEGIEREAQVRALAGLGCEDGQGFLFARPSPADAFRAYLLSRPAASAALPQAGPSSTSRRT
jgi:diguanylate cyclase (GGDEF)-like protein/PAS domain S-box-containing protein